MIKFCSLFSGSSGNAVFLKAGNTRLLMDAGVSAKRIIEALLSIGENPCDLSAILISHEHSDHIKGAGILSRKFDIPIYANEGTWCLMEREIGPVSLKNKRCFCTGREFLINDLCIKTFPIPHDASEPVGFNFFAENRKITVATDIGHVSKALLESIDKSDLLMLEANHDVEMLMTGSYPWWLKKRILSDEGHLSNEMAGKVIAYMAERGTRSFLLGHLSKENNFPELAYQTVYNELYERKITAGSDVMLDVALRDRVGNIIEL